MDGTWCMMEKGNSRAKEGQKKVKNAMLLKMYQTLRYLLLTQVVLNALGLPGEVIRPKLHHHCHGLNDQAYTA